MKITSLSTRLIGVGLMTAMLASCVSQEQYQRAVDLAEQYQDKTHKLEAELARLQRQRDSLEGEVRSQEASYLQAGGSDVDYEAKISQLQEQLQNLGRAPKDIERFDVDGGYVYMIQDKVLFDSGSAEIGAKGKSALIELANKIKGEPHGRIFVRGHTDADPVKRPETLKKFPHGNIQLSAERAVAVAAILTDEAKLPGRDVVVMGFGRWDPVAGNDSSDAKRLNRRVEIFVADATAKR
ncbi:MAG: OmpA family protein [Planctomycetes bacterium]|nr:OmpA family protein [Planctomycetota bacterium]MCB9909407.1 OmpA family protein [Planctomycetota bacterium]HPF14846.1 OmpA family protein [Planctomycetota bacterium]HRV82668.1 OmpA family protein [Planctomycetota bacterium]